MKEWKPYTDILSDRWAREVNTTGETETITDRAECVKAWKALGRVRPARWLWSLDGVTMCRAELLHCWGSLLGESPRVPVWYFAGRGCWTTLDKFPKEDAIEVTTLRDLLQVARHESTKEERP